MRKTDNELRVCPECGAAFVPRDARNVCCSDECKRARLIKFMRKRHEAERQRRERMARKCVICGKEFCTIDWRRRTCSHECSVEHYKRSSHHSADCHIGGEATKRVMQRARYAQRKRDKARRIRLARRDSLAPKPKTEIIYRNGIIIERRGTVPAGCHAADFIRHNA